ncbi:MAG: hypothetical protein NT062_02290 [Proteobacteria bacterium]|nr:hypothetical protein [Pseudomonadota bacterium]
MTNATSRWMTFALSITAAVLLLLSVGTKRWVAKDEMGHGREFGALDVGPLGVHGCELDRVDVRMNAHGAITDVFLAARGGDRCEPRWQSNHAFTTALDAAITRRLVTHEFGDLRDDTLRAKIDALTSTRFAVLGYLTFLFGVIVALALLAAVALPYTRLDATRSIPQLGKLALAAAVVALVTGGGFLMTRPGPPTFLGTGLGFWLFGIAIMMAIVASYQHANARRG